MCRVSVLALLLVSPALAHAAPAVVLPAGASPSERFAAQELQRCLKVSLGRDVVVAEGEAPAGASPVLRLVPLRPGLTLPEAVTRRLSGRAAGLAEDGVCLLGDGKGVLLAGKGSRGALNAAYTFLEEVVGCHWPEPGRELIPKRASLNLDGLSLVQNPGFRYRGIAIHGACGPEWFAQILDWLAKNRMNGFQLFPGHYEQLRPRVLDDILKRGLEPNIGGHSREFFFPAHEYFGEHPDYFAQVLGKHAPDTQLCYSNLDSAPAYAGRIVAYLKTRPEISMASLWPNDGYGFCECARCKAGHVTDIILRYCNALTRGVNAELPGIKCEFLSYIHYTVPPKEAKPDPMLVPTYCEYWSRSQFHPITDERNDNAKCRKELAAWIAAAKETTLFSYYGDDCIKRFVYSPLIDVVTADVRTYRQMDLAGQFVLLTNPESWWSNAPHLYAYTRAAWNPDIEVSRIEREYYEALYGPAAPAMQAHAAACRALFELKTAQGGTGEDVLWGMNFPAWDPAKDAETVRQFTDAVGRVREALRQARASKPDAWVLERVRKLDAAADYVEMLAQLACEMQRVAREKTPEAQARLLKLAERGLQLEVVNEDDRRGYRSARNLLIDTARGLAGKEPDIPRGGAAARKEFERRGVWMWKTDDINPSSKEKPRRVVIEVTDRVKAVGDYEAVWDYLEGADGVSLVSVGLYSTESRAEQPDDLQPEAVDTHDGFTGGGDSENVYALPLKEYRPGRRYFVVSLVYNQREFDTYGQVLFSRKE